MIQIRDKTGTALKKNGGEKEGKIGWALLHHGFGEQAAHHFTGKLVRIDLVFATGKFFLERILPFLH